MFFVLTGIGFKSGGKKLLVIFLAVLITFAGLMGSPARSVSAASGGILIEPNSWGVVTQKELGAFKDYMRERPVATDNIGNKMLWGFGNAGADTEALGMMYELTKDTELLDMMIKYTDAMLGNRNDPVTGTMIFTGKRELVWPNGGDLSGVVGAGPEMGTIVMHIVNAAKFILETPSLWDKKVPGGDSYGFGATYKERAMKYIEESEKTVESFLIPTFVKTEEGAPKLYFPNTEEFQSTKGTTPDHPGKRVMWNQEVLMWSGLQSLAEVYELLKIHPDKVALYDEIIQASVSDFIKDLRPYQKNGHTVYTWDYWPDGTTKVEEAGGAHAAYDILGLYWAYQRGKYGVPASVLTNISNTLNDVIWDDSKQKFHFKVDGTTPSDKSMNAVLWAEWIVTSEFNTDAYSKIVNDSWMNTARTTPIFAAWTFWMEHRLKELNQPAPAVPPASAVLPDEAKPASLALDKTYAASSIWKNDAGYGADKVFDKDASGSRWSADKGKTADQWVYVDFGAPATFNHVVLKEYNTRVESYKLQISDDGGNTYTDIPGTAGTTIGAGKEIYFTPVTAKRLRLYIDKASEEPSLYDFGVFDYERKVVYPEQVAFDKKKGAPSDVIFGVNAGERKLDSIMNGSYALKAGTDYTPEVNGSQTVYRLANHYLASLRDGEHLLTLKFDEGEDAVLHLTVADTSPEISIPGEASYDKNGKGDPVLPVTVTHHGNELLDIRFGNAGLQEGKDYTVTKQDADHSIYKINRALLPYGNHPLQFDFDYGDNPAVPMEIYNSGSLFNSSIGEFDKKEDAQADISIVVPGKRGSLTGIRHGSSALVKDQDYTAAAGAYSTEYQIKKIYLASLPAGESKFTLLFSSGKKAEFKIRVKDSTPPISITEAGFNKSGKISPGGDVAVVVNTRDRDIKSITEASRPLIKDRDYTVAAGDHAATYYLKKDYLEALPSGNHTFSFKFNKGKDSVLNLLVKDSTPLLGSPTIGLDKKTPSLPVSSVSVNTKGRFLSKISYDAKELTNGEDYTFADNAIQFQSAFLQPLPVGFNKLLVTFDTGETAELIIEVYDTTVSPVLNTTSVQFDKANPADILVVAYTKSGAVSSVNNGSTKLYSLMEYVGIQKYFITTFKLSKEYLSSLPVGETRLDFHKDDKTILETLKIQVKE